MTTHSRFAVGLPDRFRILSILSLLLCLAAAAPARAQNPDDIGEAPGIPSDRVLRANEAMVVSVPMDSSTVFNGSFPIDSAGYVNLPVLGKQYVHGKSVTEMQTFLGQRLAAYLKSTHIMVTPAIRLTLLGHWQKPGMIYVDPDAVLWDACRVAGGPAGEVNIHKWKVLRGSERTEIPLLNEFSMGSTLRHAGVKSGDIFVIPVPNPQSGAWYWFRETLTVTAEIAGVIGAVVTLYLTYLILDDRLDRDGTPATVP